ncbi:MAG TPA: diphosphomevalonate decarboxylase, partial [Balneolaceae bacterium]|nr:diphosphomevalonate decarboxylase [Balneolaceae bacterium]
MDLNSTEQNRHQKATAVAYANIALIKYWGKRDIELNLPAAGSISLTLDALKTETSVHFDENRQNDYFELNEKIITGKPLAKITRFLDIACGQKRYKAYVKSKNNFATSAGLASSASGFAALAVAAIEASGQKRSRKELSRLARQGSGSAARSIYGGFVEMRCEDERDCAVKLHDSTYWDVRMIIAITSNRKKSISSTAGMKRTAKTSPYYTAWLKQQPHDLNEMREAINQKDFEKMGELAERSCLKMHGLAMSAKPPLFYWNDTTVKVINIIRN